MVGRVTQAFRRLHACAYGQGMLLRWLVMSVNFGTLGEMVPGRLDLTLDEQSLSSGSRARLDVRGC